ncbi:kinase-like protein, partial [Dacryopinax primogenitus]
EAHAMWLVKRHTNVPAPMLVDYITCAIESHGFSYNAAYTLMTEVPGRPLSEVAHSLSDDELETIGLQLRGYVEELRAIPNPYPKQVCSASGGSIDCPRFTDAWEIPAYVDVPAFYAWLRMMVDKYWEICMKARLEPIFAKFDGPTVFTHGDIADRNIMIQDGKISGLIDWETAAWMPVYWEYYASL